VEVEAPAARRILAAQRKGELELVLLFDLADEAACSRGRPRSLAVEPVAWTWRAGTEELARGGAAAERPVVSASGGARARVSVGDRSTGHPPRGCGGALEPALSACYAEPEGAPLDGVLSGRPAPRHKPAIAADDGRCGDGGLRAGSAGRRCRRGRRRCPLRRARRYEPLPKLLPGWGFDRFIADW
jgi:hypothetical protein